jgi:hypothetical protein
MSLAFSSSEVAATDPAEPLTSSPITRASDDDDPSATRTTLTSEPFARNPSDKAELNVASPHGVGGYVLRTPKLAESEGRCRTRAAFDVSRVHRALKVIPTDGCHGRVRRELLLCEISGGRPISFRTGWIPNPPDTTRDERLPRIEPSQDAQADGVPTDTGVGALGLEMPFGLLERVALANESSDGLVDDRRLEKACCGFPFSRDWQVLIEDEVTEGPSVSHARSATRSTKLPGDPAYKTTITAGGRPTSPTPGSASLNEVRTPPAPPPLTKVVNVKGGLLPSTVTLSPRKVGIAAVASAASRRRLSATSAPGSSKAALRMPRSAARAAAISIKGLLRCTLPSAIEPADAAHASRCAR